MADTLCTKCRNQECEYAGRKVWVMICAHEYVAPPMTHGDQLRANSDEELAQWIMSIDPAACPFRDDHGDDCHFTHCKDCWQEWLKEEVKDE